MREAPDGAILQRTAPSSLCTAACAGEPLMTAAKQTLHVSLQTKTLYNQDLVYGPDSLLNYTRAIRLKRMAFHTLNWSELLFTVTYVPAQAVAKIQQTFQ